MLTTALGPLVRAGVTEHAPRPLQLERTLAIGFGLPALKHARTASPITSIWR